MSKRKYQGGVQLDKSVGDRIISVITYVVYALFAFVCVYPFYYIFINSISNNDLSKRGKVILSYRNAEELDLIYEALETLEKR